MSSVRQRCLFGCQLVAGWPLIVSNRLGENEPLTSLIVCPVTSAVMGMLECLLLVFRQLKSCRSCKLLFTAYAAYAHNTSSFTKVSTPCCTFTLHAISIYIYNDPYLCLLLTPYEPHAVALSSLRGRHNSSPSGINTTKKIHHLHTPDYSVFG
jgi:hypothetical protein